MSSSDERFDGLFLNAAQQIGGIDTLFDAFFGFLCRKTDFYTGCKELSDAEKTVMASFRKFGVLSQKKKDEEARKNAKRDAERRAREAAKKEQDEAEYLAKEAAASFEEVPEDAPVGIVKSEKLLVDSEQEKKKEEEEEDSGPAPIGNGGTNQKYTWTQTLATADMWIPVRPGSTSRQLGVEIKAGSLKVYYKASPDAPMVDGKLFGKVKPEDCTWLLLDNKTVHVSLEKVDQMKWWSTIVQGDEEIDTKKIVPENSKLSDLDGETRQTVEKMMHDQKMKQLGKPTSDQQAQADLLEKFKKQHPEMDFSKCKVNYGGDGGGGMMGNFDAMGGMPSMGGGAMM